jgi:cell division protein FtsL
MKHFQPMTPAEREAHEAAREARKNAPISRGDKVLIATTFAVLGVVAFAANAGWFL